MRGDLEVGRCCFVLLQCGCFNRYNICVFALARRLKTTHYNIHPYMRTCIRCFHAAGEIYSLILYFMAGLVACRSNSRRRLCMSFGNPVRARNRFGGSLDGCVGIERCPQLSGWSICL